MIRDFITDLIGAACVFGAGYVVIAIALAAS